MLSKFKLMLYIDEDLKNGRIRASPQETDGH